MYRWCTSDTFSNKTWIVIFVGLCLAISAGFLILDPDLETYFGLSGVLHGILAAGVTRSMATHLTAENRMRIEDGLIASGFTIKIVHEKLTAPASMMDNLAPDVTIVNAHVYGTSVGLVFALAISTAVWLDRRRKRTAHSSE